VSTFAVGGNLSQPFGLAFDSLGNLYAANQGGGGSVSKITPGGLVSTFAGGGLLTGPSNGDYGVAVDAFDDVFVSNYDVGTVRKITPGGVVSTFAAGLTGAAYLTMEVPVSALRISRPPPTPAGRTPLATAAP
jgi:DNA-binding beta-propeller fold protein YncE